MAGTERCISDGFPGALDAWKMGLEGGEVRREVDDFTLAGSTLSRMAVTRVTSGEPSKGYSPRGMFDVSKDTPKTKLATPFTGEYDYSGVEL